MSETRRPLILDLFCGAGGCAMGYHRAGFDVVGVDYRPMPRYPFPFVQMDALEAMRWLLGGFALIDGRGVGYQLEDFAAIHASPPCQAYSQVNNRAHMQGRGYPALLEPVRELLLATGKVYVIENVVGAPLRQAVQVCGSAFGLPIRRHRRFESPVLLFGVECQHGWQRRTGSYPTCFQEKGATRRRSSVVQVYGHTQGKALWPAAMGISWMTSGELTQAIPPAFTEFIGKQLLRAINATEPPPDPSPAAG